MRVLICGSCVSNDIFYLTKHSHVLAAYLPRMSMGTAFGALAPDHMISAAKKEIESLTHRYWALNDLEKRLGKILTSSTYDIVLLDFVDERFPLAITENESLYTCGDNLRLYAAMRMSYEKIPEKSERHFELWKKGLDAFAKLIDPKKVFINKIYWATEANDGSKFGDEVVAENNLYLEKLYHYVEKNYEFNFITFDQDVFVGDVLHKWGKFPYHYVQRYYAAAVNALNTIEAQKISKNPDGNL